MGGIAPKDAREAAVLAVRNVLERREGTQFHGFVSLTSAGADDDYAKVWRNRQPDYPLWFGAASMLLLSGSAIGVLLARRRTAASTGPAK